MASQGSPRKNSWKAKAAAQRTKSAGARWIGRIASTALVIVLVSLAIYLLVNLWSSTTGSLKMLAVHLEDDDVRQLVQVPFSKEDVHAFKENTRVHPKTVGWNDVEYGKWLSRPLDDLHCQPNDVLVVYLTGIGISYGQKAYIASRESDLPHDAEGAPDESCLEVASLLKTLHKSAGKGVKKILILDVGRFGNDPRTGRLANEFAEVLEETVRKSAGDLWVLNSTSLFQRSRVLYSKQRSVFGEAVAEALDGKADVDSPDGKGGDGLVRLFELYDYVLQACATATWSNDPLSIPGQTPLLMRGGAGVLSAKTLSKFDGDDHYDPVLVRRTGASWEDKPAAPPAGKGDGKEKGEKAARRMPRGVFSEFAFGDPFAPHDRTRNSLLVLGAGQEAGTPLESKPASDTKPASPPEKAATAPAADPAKSAGGTAAEPPAAAESRLPPEAPPVLRNLYAAWKLRDDLQSRQAHKRLSPVDFAPHLWRALDVRLLALEWRYLSRHESEADQRELEDLIRVLKELKAAIDAFRPAASTLDHPLIDVWNQFVDSQRDQKRFAAYESIVALQQDFADWCFRGVYFVRWFDHASLSDSARSADIDPPIRPFLQSLARLGQQIELLVEKSSKMALPDRDFQPLIKQSEDLREQFGRIRQVLAADLSKATRAGANPAVAEQLAEDLLHTPFCTADDRLTLCLVLRPLGEVPAAPPPAARHWDPAQIKQIKWWEGNDAQWRAQSERTELHLALVGLPNRDPAIIVPAAGKLANLPEKLDDRLKAFAEVGHELGHFYAALPRQFIDKKLDPFQAWRLAVLADGLDFLDRRNLEARSTGIYWDLRVLRNPGQIEFAAGAIYSLYEEDFAPLRLVAEGWPADLPSIDAAIEFDAQRIEFLDPAGKALKPHDAVTVPLKAGMGRGEILISARWKGPKSPPKDARQTKVLASIVARDDLASSRAAAEVIGELAGSRPVELAIRRHGPRGKIMPALLDVTGGAASLKTIPGRATGFDLALTNRTRGDLNVSVDLLAVPAVPAPPGARSRPAAHAPPTGAALRALLLDANGKPRQELVLAVAAADGKPQVPLKAGIEPASLALQKPKPPAPAAGAPADKPNPPAADPDPLKLAAPTTWDGRRLACVITTEQPAWTWIYLLDLDLMAPRDFLEPRVEYTIDTQTISVVLAVRESARDLVADLLKEPLPIKLKIDRPSAETAITAVLQGPESQLRWSVSADRRTRQFELDVAGYPRAFRYKIVCAEGREGEELLPSHPAVRIRSLRSTAKNGFTYVPDLFALGDTAPAAAAPPPPSGEDPAASAERWLAPGAWAAFPQATTEVDVIVGVDMPLDNRDNPQSRTALPVAVRLEDSAKETIATGRIVVDGVAEYRLVLREDGSFAVAGVLPDRRFRVLVGNAPRQALSLVAEVPDETAKSSETETAVAVVEDRVPLVVGPRPLELRFSIGDRPGERASSVKVGADLRLSITLATDESTGKPRPNAGLAPQRVSISVKGSDDKPARALKSEEDLSGIEQDASHWAAKWKVPAQYTDQQCLLTAVVFDGLGQRTEESVSVYVKNAEGAPVVGPGKPTKGTIRIKMRMGSEALKNPKLEELPGRAPVAVRVSDQDYWEWTNLDLDQTYTITADYFHDGTFEVLTSEPNVKPSDPKSPRVTPLMSKKKK